VRAILIVNPRASSTTAGGRDVLAHALASAVKLEVVETSHRGHAWDIAKSASEDGVGLVVVHGGDGTVNEAVNGLLNNELPDHHAGSSRADFDNTRNGSSTALGVVPGGSANVFARALGMTRDPLEATHQLLGAIENRRQRSVGLGLADGLWFTFNAGLGWDADVVAGVANRRGKQASPALYLRNAISAHLRPPLGRPAMRVLLDGEDPVEVRTVFVSNTDPWSYLGSHPVHLNSECSFDTGLGLFALRGLSLPTVLRHVRQALSQNGKQRGRKLLRKDDVKFMRIEASERVNFQMDGDLIGQRTSMDFVSVSNALTVMI
jgi:diacylglycerol kinase family enzyme